MANKDLYVYTVKMDNDGNMEIFNETGKVETPENPICYLLVGLIACMASTARAILAKMRIDYEKLVVGGKLYMVDEKIRYGDRIECNMSLEGSELVDPATKKRIAEITEKYCTVSVTIKNNPKITLSME
ncbi:MAG TPA: OsmC family protein [Bacillota bacterium]|nr:MAG: OsmC-like protein [Firmicutes bacterium ADurb.Bin153]HNV35077.1 OsmC family protein [Bacillota bacterium]HPV31096.1 OsmC family protein [Deltaproteobacteria bacterium]